MARNYLYNLLLTVANILFPILSFPYAAHVLGPEGIGKAQFVFTFAQYFAVFAALGIPTYGLTEIARKRDDPAGRSAVFSELTVIYFLSSLVLVLIYFGVISYVPFFSGDRGLYLAGGLFVFLSFSSIDWLYSGLEEFKVIALRSIAIKVISLILLFILVREDTDYHYYLYIMMFSYLGNNLLSFLLVKSRVKVLLKGLNLRRHLKPLWLIFAATLASSMYTLMDTVLIGFLSDEKAVGLYTAAVKLVKIALPVITSMGVILIPRITKAFSGNDLEAAQGFIDQTSQFVSFFAIPVGAGLVILAPEFIHVFSGDKFLPAVFSMQILALLPLIIGFGHLFLLLILIPAGRNREMLYAVLGGMISGLVLNFLLVPHLREVGASVANVTSEIIVTGLYLYFIRRHFSFRFHWSLLLKASVCVLPFLPIVWLVRSIEMNSYIALFVSICSCSMLYFILQWTFFKSRVVEDMLRFVKAKLGVANQSVEL